VKTKAFNSTLQFDIYKLNGTHKYLFGSRRILSLNNVDAYSDYDIYLNIDKLEKLGTSFFELKRLGLLKNIDEYTTSGPKYGKAYLMYKIPVTGSTKGNTADILLFTDERDIAIMDKVLTTLENSVASTLLIDKELRIAVYNYLLQLEGFTPSYKEHDHMPIITKQLSELILASYINPIEVIKPNLFWKYTP